MSKELSPAEEAERRRLANPNYAGVSGTYKPTDENDVRYTVEDLNCSKYNKKKQHEIAVKQPNGKVQIKKFNFEPGVPLVLDRAIALIFLEVSEAFRVKNSQGQIVRPKRYREAGVRKVDVGPTEIVVDVKYVVKQKLWDLAREMPGGMERFPSEHNKIERIELEEFIISGGKIEEDHDGNLIDTVAA